MEDTTESVVSEDRDERRLQYPTCLRRSNLSQARLGRAWRIHCDYGCITYPRSPFLWGLIFRNTTLCRSHSHRVNSSFPGLLEHRNHNPEAVTQKNFVSYPHHLDKISSFSLLCLLCARSLRVLDSSRSAFRLQLDGSRRSQQGYVSGYVT